jgi:hypothetical protein
MAREYWVTISDSAGHAVRKVNALYISYVYLRGEGPTLRLVIEYNTGGEDIMRGPEHLIVSTINRIKIAFQEVLNVRKRRAG